MEVILLERVEKLGQMGDVVTVKSGYARNYLLPQKKALRKTKDNLSFFGTQKTQLQADNLARREEAQEVAAKIKGLTVPIIRAAGDSGQLYGSVTARDISDAISAAGMTVARQQVVIDRALKTLGLERIRVSLHPEVSVDITVNIARTLEESEQQLQLGRAVGTRDEQLDDEEDENQRRGESRAKAQAVFEAPVGSDEAPAPNEAAEGTDNA
jgi:large subunit ribosomal protein L9